jgi:hypothetical protein
MIFGNTVNREIFAPAESWQIFQLAVDKIPRLLQNLMVNALELKFSHVLSSRLTAHSRK